MNFESWCNAFRPIINPNGYAFGFDDTNYMFETFGRDFAAVKMVCSIDATLIWTIVESESGDVLVAGYHKVNRVGYFIATVQHTGRHMELPLGELAFE